MLSTLSAKLDGILKRLRGHGVLNEATISEALKEVRLALLEADVHFTIVKEFIERIRVKAIGQEVQQSLTPGHQVVKIVWEELRALMGQEHAGLALSSMPPTVILLVGLQGAGKTTTCGKLARHFKAHGRRILLVAADPRRPAAVEQLVALGTTLGVPVHHGDAPGLDAVSVCVDGVERARTQGFDVAILDTGGRLHIDDELMNELVAIRAKVSPHEVLLVADAMIGQDAVTMAEQFDRRVGLTGVILTKVEGDARGETFCGLGFAPEIGDGLVHLRGLGRVRFRAWCRSARLAEPPECATSCAYSLLWKYCGTMTAPRIVRQMNLPGYV